MFTNLISLMVSYSEPFLLAGTLKRQLARIMALSSNINDSCLLKVGISGYQMRVRCIKTSKGVHHYTSISHVMGLIAKNITPV